jgi:hypothetical protein
MFGSCSSAYMHHHLVSYHCSLNATLRPAHVCLPGKVPWSIPPSAPSLLRCQACLYSCDWFLSVITCTHTPCRRTRACPRCPGASLPQRQQRAQTSAHGASSALTPSQQGTWTTHSAYSRWATDAGGWVCTLLTWRALCGREPH